MKIIFCLVTLLFTPQIFALDLCGDNVDMVSPGKDGQFSLAKPSKQTDWVKVRFIIGKNGEVTDPKPIAFSSDLYINRAHKRIKRMTFQNAGEQCYMDLVLYRAINLS